LNDSFRSRPPRRPAPVLVVDDAVVTRGSHLVAARDMRERFASGACARRPRRRALPTPSSSSPRWIGKLVHAADLPSNWSRPRRLRYLGRP